MIARDDSGMNIDMLAILYADTWLGVLAAPHQYRVLKRPVDIAHLVRLMDIWIVYAERGDNYMAQKPDPVRDAQRPALARKLRALIAAWTPPELPVEITEAARALLEAEGSMPRGVKEAGGWDNYTFDESTDGHPLERHLSWPETEIMLKEATDAEREAANAKRRIQFAQWRKDQEEEEEARRPR